MKCAFKLINNYIVFIGADSTLTYSAKYVKIIY